MQEALYLLEIAFLMAIRGMPGIWSFEPLPDQVRQEEHVAQHGFKKARSGLFHLSAAIGCKRAKQVEHRLPDIIRKFFVEPVKRLGLLS